MKWNDKREWKQKTAKCVCVCVRFSSNNIEHERKQEKKEEVSTLRLITHENVIWFIWYSDVSYFRLALHLFQLALVHHHSGRYIEL